MSVNDFFYFGRQSWIWLERRKGIYAKIQREIGSETRADLRDRTIYIEAPSDGQVNPVQASRRSYNKSSTSVSPHPLSSIVLESLLARLSIQASISIFRCIR